MVALVQENKTLRTGVNMKYTLYAISFILSFVTQHAAADTLAQNYDGELILNSDLSIKNLSNESKPGTLDLGEGCSIVIEDMDGQSEVVLKAGTHLRLALPRLADPREEFIRRNRLNLREISTGEVIGRIQCTAQQECGRKPIYGPNLGGGNGYGPLIGHDPIYCDRLMPLSRVSLRKIQTNLNATLHNPPIRSTLIIETPASASN